MLEPSPRRRPSAGFGAPVVHRRPDAGINDDLRRTLALARGDVPVDRAPEARLARALLPEIDVEAVDGVLRARSLAKTSLVCDLAADPAALRRILLDTVALIGRSPAGALALAPTEIGLATLAGALFDVIGGGDHDASTIHRALAQHRGEGPRWRITAHEEEVTASIDAPAIAAVDAARLAAAARRLTPGRDIAVMQELAR